MEVLLHPRTQKTLEAFLQKKPHTILLTGQRGVGKDTIAKWYVAKLLNIEPGKLADYPYYKHIAEDASISIEHVREITAFLKLVTPGEAGIRRVIHISDADNMTNEAQNALLKTLEEPPADTCIILTASQPKRLLRTIHSRTQACEVICPPLTVIKKYFAHEFPSSNEVDKMILLSAGLPGLTHALLAEDEHPLTGLIATAKQFIVADQYRRLTMIETLVKEQATITDLLWAMDRIAQLGQRAAASKEQSQQVKRWQSCREAIAQSESSTRSGVNKKLILTDLALQI
ncbi:hypothetical protein KA047_00780 [Candidatus Saccharibacteria bacterium]|nr:hypothetical protein [Candidatus Saccharibacteria bacterium]